MNFSLDLFFPDPQSVCLRKVNMTKCNSSCFFCLPREKKNNETNIFLDSSSRNCCLSLDKEATSVNFCKAEQKYLAFIICLIIKFHTTLTGRWERVWTGNSHTCACAHTHTHTHTHRSLTGHQKMFSILMRKKIFFGLLSF